MLMIITMLTVTLNDKANDVPLMIILLNISVIYVCKHTLYWEGYSVFETVLR